MYTYCKLPSPCKEGRTSRWPKESKSYNIVGEIPLLEMDRGEKKKRIKKVSLENPELEQRQAQEGIKSYSSCQFPGTSENTRIKKMTHFENFIVFLNGHSC